LNSKIAKFENPVRLEELKPEETLLKIGLQDNHDLCDVGAGSGVFTFPAAAMLTKGKVYALEINDEMLAVMEEKSKKAGISNIEFIKVQDNRFEIESYSVDIVLMVTVLHEIENKNVILQEVKRVLKDTGKFAVIEFHKRETPTGPPTTHRLGKDEVEDLLTKAGFRVKENFDLGENFYCLVFSR